MKSFQDISRTYTTPISFDNVTKYVLKFKTHSNWNAYVLRNDLLDIIPDKANNYMRKKRPYRLKDNYKHSSIWYGHVLYQKVPILSIPFYDGYIHSNNYFAIIRQLMGAPRLITKDIQISEGMRDITH